MAGISGKLKEAFGKVAPFLPPSFLSAAFPLPRMLAVPSLSLLLPSLHLWNLPIIRSRT